MRFPRQARVFHGQLEAAPVAGVVLLLVIFMQVGVLLHPPGMLVYLNNARDVITVSRDGLIHRGTNVYSVAESNLLRHDLQSASVVPPFDIRVAPNTPSNLALAAQTMLSNLLQTNPAATIFINRDGTLQFGTNSYTLAESNSLRLALRRSSAGPPFNVSVAPDTSAGVAANARNLLETMFQIKLPSGSTNLIGAANPTVVVGMNFGRYFYRNRIVEAPELRTELSQQLQAAAARSEELTVIIAADEMVTMSELAGLEELVRQVGVKEILLAERTEQPEPANRIKP